MGPGKFALNLVGLWRPRSVRRFFRGQLDALSSGSDSGSWRVAVSVLVRVVRVLKLFLGLVLANLLVRGSGLVLGLSDVYRGSRF